MKSKMILISRSAPIVHLALLFTLAVSLTSAAQGQTVTSIASPGISYAGLVLDRAGNLYGVTQTGGNSNCNQGCGTVFELSPTATGTWTQTILYYFQGLSDGSQPYGGLVFDAAGNLYGTTQIGGGTLFKLSPGSGGTWTLTTLYAFTKAKDAQYPNSSLIIDKNGNLYGTTIGGGHYGFGTVFKLLQTSSGWKEAILHSFGGPDDGVQPNGPLVMDAAGHIYGTTSAGGSATLGTVFELSYGVTGPWTETILHTFTGTSDGGEPAAGLVLDSAHDLYGTTYTGGALGVGAVFRLTLRNNAWKETLLYTFTGQSDGANPDSPLTLDAAGNLYGTTDDGDPAGCNSFYGCGQVYKLSNTANQWDISALYPIPAFLDPNGALILDAAGNIYGTSIDNHYFDYGNVFEVIP